MSKQQLRKEWRIESEYSRIFTGGDIFLSKNEQVVYGLSDAGIKIFDIDSPNLASTISKVYFGISLLKENEEIVGFVVDHSERNLVSFSRNMLLRVWDLETKICKRSLKSHDSYIVTMDFDSSGKLIATGGTDRSVKVFDMTKGYLTHNFKRDHNSPLTLVKFASKKPHTLISISSDRRITIYDLIFSTKISSLALSNTPSSCLDFSKDGTFLITSEAYYYTKKPKSFKNTTQEIHSDTEIETKEGSKITIWKTEKFTKQGFFTLKKQIQSFSYVFLPFPRKQVKEPTEPEEVNGIQENVEIEWENKPCLIIGGESGVVSLVDVNEGKVIMREQDSLKETILRIIPFAKFNQNAQNLRNKNKLNSQNQNQIQEEEEEKNTLSSVVAKFLCVTKDANLLFYQISLNKTGKLVLERFKDVVGYFDEITQISCFKSHKNFSNSVLNDYCIMATNSQLFNLINLNDFSSKLIPGHQDIVMSVDTIGPFFATSSKDNSVRLWVIEKDETIKIKCLAIFQGHTETVNSVKIAPKRMNILCSCGEDKTIKIWDISLLIKDPSKIENPKLIKKSACTNVGHSKSINAVAITPNDKIVASASQDHSIKLWKSENLELIQILKGHSAGVWDITFNPLEKSLASCSGDNTIKIWDFSASSIECVNTLVSTSNSVLKLAWINLGLMLVSIGADPTLHVWNPKTGLSYTFPRHEGKVWALDAQKLPQQLENSKVKFQYRILTGGTDSIFAIWKDVTESVEEERNTEFKTQIEEEQALSNLLFEGSVKDSAILAFKLNKAKQFSMIIEKILNQEQLNYSNPKNLDPIDSVLKDIQDFDSEFLNAQTNSLTSYDNLIDGTFGSSICEIQEIVSVLAKLDLNKLLKMIRDLNTNSRFFHIAQTLLSCIFSKIHPRQLIGLRNEKYTFKNAQNRRKREKKKQNKNAGALNEPNNFMENIDWMEFKELLDVIISYSERHSGRIDRMIKNTYLVDFLMNKMAIYSQKQVPSNYSRNQLVKKKKKLFY